MEVNKTSNMSSEAVSASSGMPDRKNTTLSPPKADGTLTDSSEDVPFETQQRDKKVVPPNNVSSPESQPPAEEISPATQPPMGDDKGGWKEAPPAVNEAESAPKDQTKQVEEKTVSSRESQPPAEEIPLATQPPGDDDKGGRKESPPAVNETGSALKDQTEQVEEETAADVTTDGRQEQGPLSVHRQQVDPVPILRKATLVAKEVAKMNKIESWYHGKAKKVVMPATQPAKSAPTTRTEPSWLDPSQTQLANATSAATAAAGADSQNKMPRVMQSLHPQPFVTQPVPKSTPGIPPPVAATTSTLIPSETTITEAKPAASSSTTSSLRASAPPRSGRKKIVAAKSVLPGRSKKRTSANQESAGAQSGTKRNTTADASNIKAKKQKTPPRKKATPKKKQQAAKEKNAPRPPAKEIWSGEPDDPLEGGWPAGWTKKTFQRQSGATKGSTDSYWFSPLTKRKLRSMTEVRRFVKALKEVDGGDEDAAFKKMKGK